MLRAIASDHQAGSDEHHHLHLPGIATPGTQERVAGHAGRRVLGPKRKPRAQLDERGGPGPQLLRWVEKEQMHVPVDRKAGVLVDRSAGVPVDRRVRAMIDRLVGVRVYPILPRKIGR